MDCQICNEEIVFEVSRKGDHIDVHCGCRDWSENEGTEAIPSEWPIESDALYAACDNIMDSL